jgi:hypothetical protein
MKVDFEVRDGHVRGVLGMHSWHLSTVVLELRYHLTSLSPLDPMD